MRRDLHEANRRSWNAVTPAHNSHKGDQAAFLRGGGSTLFDEELELLGAIDGKDLLHLACNCGQDTLSLAAHGARVTGVDIADAAIAVATQLSADIPRAARFERADVYDYLEAAAPGSFDRVFISYGGLCWLSDLAALAAGAAKVLRPGGRLVILEFHPFSYMFEADMKLRWPYFGRGQADLDPEGVSDYVGKNGAALVPWGFEAGVQGFENPHPSHFFTWGLGDLVNACVDAGLQIQRLQEYPFANGASLFDPLVQGEDRRWRWPAGHPEVPLMYGLVARSP